MTYVQKSIMVLVCDLCLRDLGNIESDDVVITQTFQPTESSVPIDICQECWGRIRAIVHREDEAKGERWESGK